MDEIDGRIAEIDAELAEEEARRQSGWRNLKRTLKQLSAARAAQESVLENIRKNAALLDEQRKLTSTLLARRLNAHARLSRRSRLVSPQKEADRASYADLVNRAKEIESAYKAWQKARKELEELDKVASEFHEHEKERAPLLEQIAVEKARLEEEQRALLAEEAVKSVNQTISESVIWNMKLHKRRNFWLKRKQKIKERAGAGKPAQCSARTTGRIESQKTTLSKRT